MTGPSPSVTSSGCSSVGAQATMHASVALAMETAAAVSTPVPMGAFADVAHFTEAPGYDQIGDVADVPMPKPVSVVPVDGPAAFKAGLAAMWQEDLPTAEAFLRAAVDFRPDDAAAHAYLGCVLFASGSIEAGMLASDYALQLDPHGFAPQMKAGEMVLRLGDLERAADLFLGAMRAARPGSREAIAAKAARTTALRAAGRSIRHGAVLPGWLAARLPGAKPDRLVSGLVSGPESDMRRIDR